MHTAKVIHTNMLFQINNPEEQDIHPTTNSEAVHPWLLEDINLPEIIPARPKRVRFIIQNSIQNKEATSRTKQRLLGGMSATNFGRIHHHITHPRQL